MTTEMRSVERRFAALAREKALSFFAANPSVRPATGGFGLSFRAGVAELEDNGPGGPFACLITPLLLLRKADGIIQALEGLAVENGVSVVFISALSYGWDIHPSTLRVCHPSYSDVYRYANAVKAEVDEMRRTR